MSDPVQTAAGKAGRNEALKLRAGWLNTTSAALFLAALLQPVLGVAQQQRAVTAGEAMASVAFLALSYVLYLRGQKLAKTMED
jgi:hypothetical protein